MMSEVEEADNSGSGLRPLWFLITLGYDGAWLAGRRFLTIAGEVRELAEQTMDATERVQQIVTSLEEASNQALIATEEGSKKVEAAHDLVETLGRSFGNITQTASRTTRSAEEIALSSEQQTKAGEHLAKVLSDINQVAKSFVESAREIENATLTISQLSRNLEQAAKGEVEKDGSVKEARHDK